MFDVGFTELMVIAVVALIVIGPERLPKVARTAGHLLGRLQRYVNDVKADINREMQLEELRRLQSEVESSAREIETSINKEVSAVEDTLNKAAAPTETPPAADSPSAAEPRADAATETPTDTPNDKQLELAVPARPANTTTG